MSYKSCVHSQVASLLIIQLIAPGSIPSLLQKFLHFHNFFALMIIFLLFFKNILSFSIFFCPENFQTHFFKNKEHFSKQFHISFSFSKLFSLYEKCQLGRFIKHFGASPQFQRRRGLSALQRLCPYYLNLIH